MYICDRVRENQPYAGEINFEIRAFIATSGINSFFTPEGSLMIVEFSYPL